MQFKKIVPYKIRRMIPMLGMAGATLFMGGCDKNNLTPEPVTPTRDVELTFTQDDFTNVRRDDENGNRLPSDLAMYYLNDPSVRYIYFVPKGDWTNLVAHNITFMRENTLGVVLSYSPRFKGRGDFNFGWGEASKVPEDSLWYVANGWTINRYRDGPGPNTKQR